MALKLGGSGRVEWPTSRAFLLAVKSFPFLCEKQELLSCRGTMADWKESNPKIDRSNVLMVYTGKQGCMCGCNGKYRYPKANVELGAAQRGYALNDEEVNEGTVTRILNLMATRTDVEVGEIYNRESGDSLIYCWDDEETGRRLAVYTKPGAPYIKPVKKTDESVVVEA